MCAVRSVRVYVCVCGWVLSVVTGCADCKESVCVAGGGGGGRGWGGG